MQDPRSNFDESIRGVRFAMPYVPIAAFPQRILSFTTPSTGISGLWDVPRDATLIRFGCSGAAATERGYFVGDPENVNRFAVGPGVGVFEGCWTVRTQDKLKPLFFVPWSLKNFYARAFGGLLSTNTLEVWYQI